MKSNILLSWLLALCINVSAQGIPAYALVITEIFPDPSPVVGLPPFEFVEIQNKSGSPLPLKGCKLSDGSSTATLTSSIILGPDSLLILCPSSAVGLYQAFGTCIGLSNFPSLNNDKDRLVLLSPEGKTIHAVEYDISWYQHPLKQEGGWTLEMKDPMNPCAGKSNWGSSLNYAGGTPGRKNSLLSSHPDQEPPMLLRTYSKDLNKLVLVFNEPLDSNSLWKTNQFSLQPTGSKPISVKAYPPFFQELEIEFDKNLDSNQIYEITVNNIRDCSTNLIGAYKTSKAGIASESNNRQLVINEILFNPSPEGADYVELYNSGSKILDLSKLMICNRKDNGDLYNLYPLTTQRWYLFPNSYAVVTTSPEWLQKSKLVRYPGQLIVMESLPSLPDDEGTLVLSDLNLNIIDELHYQHLWHHPLLVNEEDVSLERINYKSPTQEKSNWGSAAANAGYGTPTYQNSMFIFVDSVKIKMSVEPKLFTPNHDGQEDRVSIQVATTDNSSMLSIGIYDVGGTLVRQLVKLQSLSGMGLYFWDGLDFRDRNLARGHYWVVAEVFGMGGKVRRMRELIALGK